ncbi:hypothetical protein LPB140_05110 [Sphingorhabdus lutea]|uniref:DUF481 domain-containing protein n=1 Tax=Sphingorhabdus lutea TaxID=1913578 RepID=A0A1L3JAW9_9SPHN|nr:DUF481 domain-containing protein [Sphingorhabdus lutea]APG62285.1 hypothetical protein LPB140_05110 [Sphingorhabdus lutea]
MHILPKAAISAAYLSACLGAFSYSIPLAHAQQSQNSTEDKEENGQEAQKQGIEDILDAAIAADDESAVDAIAKYSKNNPNITKKAEEYKAAKAEKNQLAKAEKLKGNLFQNWHGSGEFGAFQSSGNSENIGISAGIKLLKESKSWRLKFNAQGDFQRSNGVTSREQIIVGLEPHYVINDRLFAYGLTQFERDKFQGFLERYTLSGGLGYQIIKTDIVQLDVKAGPAWRDTKFTDGRSDVSIAGLAAANFKTNIASNIIFRQDASAYVQSGNSSLAALSALDAKLSDNLTARLSYQVKHETNPPAGREKTDTLSRVTVIVGF